ncbi:N-acetylmuramoyl-L-alanine amidase [Dongia sedimenti]|uniref:N-acetylmuramoyl-L-alanine amidase n=1 Tax=Dongia sedimenti TaxID=3064282 RepID=A0ABU0YK21_9PROT|nr:N-acetylmuramoyl-L-alanine amidase [Rhodospirillaceae bacterium R-7]
MRDLRWLFAWATRIVFLAAIAFAVPAEAKPVVTGAKLGVEPNLTRVELALSETAEYRVFALAAPNRIVIDMSEVAWKVKEGKKLQGRGLVAALRYGLFKAGTSRIVLDLTAPAAVTDARILPANGSQPVRLTLDLRPTDSAAFKSAAQTILFASAGAAAPGGPATPAEVAPKDKAPKLADAMLPGAKTVDKGGAVTLQVAPKVEVIPAPEPAPKPLIVIDPGHGGIDPGALGSNTMEKNITLSVAKQLRQQLLATGRFRVVMTRDKDVFVPLRDRFKIARDKGADLFISLHADSNPSGQARGASVYTLSDKASDAEAEALATKENKSDVIAGVDLSKENQTVTGILIDLAQRETINMSSRFASILVNDLQNDTLMLQNSHRFAGFAVLKAPDVPSVLLEMGYVSSSADERLLTDAKHQKKLAGSITRSIEDYFDWRDMIRQTWVPDSGTKVAKLP